MHESALRVEGIEPSAHGLKGRCAKTVTRDGITTYDDPKNALHQNRHQSDELHKVIEAWPGLSAPIQKAILAMVESSE